MAQAVARIVETPDVLGGKPRIDGTRIGVYFVHEQIDGRGVDPKTLAAEHDLDVADVYRALTYYYDHPERMAAIQSRREQRLKAGEADPRAATGPDDLGDTDSG
ncbi:DUF433 domain-containing protein [Halococcus agarilyticus]|uniref:DUF433 domain-containing protein n=1 Tax=Halococcus agarilyticus TaxID=1232219 RepID=UPI0009ABDAE4|nr:DUF433 domain-containing protein [Halococcus agarilyticus]